MPFLASSVRLLWAFCLGMAVLLWGCQPTPTPVTTPASAPVPPAVVRIGLVMKTLTNPFFVDMESGARRAAKELPIQLLVRTAAQETSIEQQIQLVEDLIADKVHAIVIAPGDSQRLVPALHKAQRAGIHIVNIDNRLDDAAIQRAQMQPVPFLSVDNEAGAYKAAQYLARHIKAPTQAAILEGIRSADNARQRAQGARKAFAENPHIHVVASETANWKIDEAYAVTRKIFEQHPDIKLVFASNDIMAIGAIRYLQERGRTSVQVAGFDALEEAIAEIAARRLVATIDQQAAEQGYQGIHLAWRLIQKQPVSPLTVIDTRLVTAESLPKQ
ncbi:substrate-binding domain-containing protein [Candidatus Symbiobacter mobilis]|uniref:Ribose transporter substrate-binding protein n=1 Tax=Candidatus Symbiobacter mobilis CR TaxID=946483 RepID=U5NAD1_9BURK|nr:substrate-binding domain-containing protein [Candidatus Symbiobacter mobilis]AGX87218.1 ribose transporter substrate-binding protein [Candidatus Symbiobacter mobilis CR]